jgi:hypothetical protein
MGLSFEVSCFVYEEGIYRQLLDWMEALIADSNEVDRAALDRKGTLQKLGESAAHLLSPIL